MRAQATASGGHCTVLGSRVLYSAVTLVLTEKRHGIRQTFSKEGMILFLIGFCLFVHATRGGGLFLPIAASLPPLATGSNTASLAAKDGDDDVCCGQ